jgi:hypothetical protein
MKASKNMGLRLSGNQDNKKNKNPQRYLTDQEGDDEEWPENVVFAKTR